jgi:DNA modification methylase
MNFNELTGDYWRDSHRMLFNKDCRSMIELADNSIQCCVTSPPYWGLRKYAGEQDIKEWGCSFGLEPTPQLYLDHLVEICREIKRVLRKDGVFFLNIGDSYKGSGGAGGDYNKGGLKEGQPKYPGRKVSQLKPKDLCLIPQRAAIRLQEDGWWVRSIIIWSKNNPMPESVTDRPTESHEYIIMLTKSAKYYWDAEAVREPQKQSSIDRYRAGDSFDKCGTPGENYPDEKREHPHNFRAENLLAQSGRNIRSVWSFPTQGFPGAHFATFPEKLPEICIKAATPEAGCCPKCGKPYQRILEKKRGERHETEAADLATDGDGANRGKHAIPTETKTLGWQPQCKCQDAEKIPSTVLDCFAGSGTTLLVATKLGRRSVGYELSEEYCRLIVQRNKQSVLL